MSETGKRSPQSFAQKSKRGKGWVVTRNSATLCDTDFEKVADEIVRAVNSHADLLAALQSLATMAAPHFSDEPQMLCLNIAHAAIKKATQA